MIDNSNPNKSMMVKTVIVIILCSVTLMITKVLFTIENNNEIIKLDNVKEVYKFPEIDYGRVINSCEIMNYSCSKRFVQPLLYNGEVDLFKLRLNIYDKSLIHTFVLICDYDLAGAYKPIRKPPDHGRNIVLMCDQTCKMKSKGRDDFSIENCLRRQLYNRTIASKEYQRLEGDFWVFVGDIDEIPNLCKIKNESDEVVLFNSTFRINNLQHLNNPSFFILPAVVRSTIMNDQVHLLRSDPISHANVIYQNAGIHCSYCFGTLEQYNDKLLHFTHRVNNSINVDGFIKNSMIRQDDIMTCLKILY